MGSEEQKRESGVTGDGLGLDPGIWKRGRTGRWGRGGEGREKECFREQKAEAGMAHAWAGRQRRAEHRGLTEA